MVVIFLSATVPTRVMHERCAFPSINTVQAPHCPSPQPYLLPVRSRSSRRTLSRLLSASTSIFRAAPLTFNSPTLSIGASVFDSRTAVAVSQMPCVAWLLPLMLLGEWYHRDGGK